MKPPLVDSVADQTSRHSEPDPTTRSTGAPSAVLPRTAVAARRLAELAALSGDARYPSAEQFAAGTTVATAGQAQREAFEHFGELVAEVLKLAALLVFGR